MLLPVTGTVLVGVVLGSSLPYVPLLVLLILILGAVLLVIGECTGRLTPYGGAVLYGGLLAGVLLWATSLRQGDETSVAGYDGHEPVLVEGTIVAPLSSAPNRVAIVLSELRVGEGSEQRAVSGRLRVTWREPDRMFLPGDRLAFTGRVHPPSGTLNPGGFDYGAYLARRGIDAVASVSGPGKITLRSAPSPVSRWSVWRVIEDWRGRIRRAALASLNGLAAGIYLGIIIGEQGYLAAEERDAFMATGTVHILSISGSHLGLVAFLSFFLTKGFCRALPAVWLLALSRRVTPTRLAAVVTVVPVVFYALLAGAEVATVRSLVMIVVFLLAVWLGRERDVLRAVAFAALLIVVHEPRALMDISFQLSYVSVLAIALVLRWRGGDALDQGAAAGSPIRERLWRWVREYFWLTGSVTLATVPLVASYFKQIAWLGLVANLLVIPLAGLILVPLGLGSAVWLLVTGADTLPAASVNQALLDGMSGMVHLFARIPGAEWHVASPSMLSVVLFYALLVMAGRPVQALHERWRRWGCGVSAVLLLGWWAWPPHGPADGDTLRVTFLDVGQGDATVLELPDGQTILIDAGARYDTLDMGRTVVGPYLWERGIVRLDHVIGTHPQLDHIGGLAWVLRSFEVGHYWSNGVARDEPFYSRLRDALQERGVREDRAEEGRVMISSGPCRLRSLNPPAGDGNPGNRRVEAARASSGSRLNNLSVVARLDCGPHSFLFTADVEVDALARLTNAEAIAGINVLKVPHHGAASSLYEPWIAQLGASTAVISVGRYNAYGHPTKAVLTAYERVRARVLRTDRDGAVWMTGRLSHPALTLQTAREGLPRPVPLNSSLFAAELRNWQRIWQQWVAL